MLIFCKVFIQTILFYEAKSWVKNEKVRNKLHMFRNRCASSITGQFITKEDDTWTSPETMKTLESQIGRAIINVNCMLRQLQFLRRKL